jgi:hypothetical protein
MEGVGIFQVQVVAPPEVLPQSGTGFVPKFERCIKGYTDEEIKMYAAMGMRPSRMVNVDESTQFQPQMMRGISTNAGADMVAETPEEHIEVGAGLSTILESDMDEELDMPQSNKNVLESLPLDLNLESMESVVKIGTFTVPATTDTEIFQLKCPGDFFDIVAQMVWKLTNVAAIVFDFKFTFEVISQPTVAGLCMAWASPGARIPRSTGEIATGPNILLDLGAKTGGSMVVPFARDSLALFGDGYNGVNRSKDFDWVVLGCTTASGRNPIDSEAAIAVYVQLVNVQAARGGLTTFPVPALQTAKRRPKAKKDGGEEVKPQMFKIAKKVEKKVEKGLSAVNEAADMTGNISGGIQQGIKTVGNIMKTVGPLALTVAQLAALSRPDSVSEGICVSSVWCKGMCQSVGSDTGSSLSIFPGAISIPSPDTFNDVHDGGDPMDLEIACRRKGLYTRFQYQTATTRDDIIFGTNVGIGCVDVDTFGNVTPGGACFTGSHFAFWRADIVYTFRVAKTAFHNGNLRVIVQYGSEGEPDSPSVASVPYTVVWDLSKRSTLEIVIPYFHKYHWRKFNYIYESDGMDFNIPHLSVVANTELQANDAVAPVIDILVFVHAENVSFIQPQASLSSTLSKTAPAPVKVLERGKMAVFGPQAAHDSVEVLESERVVLGKTLRALPLEELAARFAAGQVITSGAHLLRRFLPVETLASLAFLTPIDLWDFNQSAGQGIGPFLDVFSRLFTHAVGGWRLKFVPVNTAGSSLFEVSTRLEGKSMGLLGAPVAVTTSFDHPAVEISVPRDMPQSVWLLGPDGDGKYQRGRAVVTGYVNFGAARVYLAGGDDLRFFGHNYLGRFGVTNLWENSEIENYSLPTQLFDN